MQLKKLKEFKPDWFLPPALTIFECAHEAGISPHELIEKLEITPEQFHRLGMGDEPITPELAEKLEATLGGSAQLWLNLQSQYEESRKRQATRSYRIRT